MQALCNHMTDGNFEAVMLEICNNYQQILEMHGYKIKIKGIGKQY